MKIYIFPFVLCHNFRQKSTNFQFYRILFTLIVILIFDKTNIVYILIKKIRISDNDEIYLLLT